MRVRLETLGCRLNTSEIEHLARQLMARGHQIVGPETPADVCVLNSCAVTHVAARKSRQMIRRLREDCPAARLVVTGCYATLEPDQTLALGANVAVSNRDKGHLADLLAPQPRLQLSEMDGWHQHLATSSQVGPFPGARTRAFIKVQDGCDCHCTFCVVTIARGPGRSRPADEIVAEVRRMAAEGYQEVVLSGVHLGSYGRDLGEARGLFRLVSRVVRETDIRRLRLSSLEPWDLDDDFFSLWEDKRLSRHLHLPLQSGCDATLRRMGRRITSEGFARLVATARAAIPDLSVTTDVMVGFPGESEAEFSTSLDFVEAMAFAKLHVFRYSARPGTPAAQLPDRVAPKVMAERSQRMQQASDRMGRAFRQRFIGRTMEVLWESCQVRGAELLWDGLTDNYLRVTALGPANLRNVITAVYLEADTAQGLQGKIL